MAEWIVEITDGMPHLKNMQPLVRCKDCKWYKDGWCYNPNTFDDEKTRGNTTEGWFCADGERKEKDDGSDHAETGD